jgi:hypothetical protein
MIRRHLLVVEHDGRVQRMAAATLAEKLAAMREMDERKPEYFGGILS